MVVMRAPVRPPTQVSKAFDNMTDGKRILREIKLLRMFQHDNVMSITDLFPPPSQTAPKELADLYIVADLMDTDLYADREKSESEQARVRPQACAVCAHFYMGPLLFFVIFILSLLSGTVLFTRSKS